jgi:hypothetical protein
MFRKLITIILVLLIAVSIAGCGLISLISTPTNSESKIPAEYKFVNPETAKVAVIVKQPVRADIRVNLPYYLTRAVNRRLMYKTGLTSGSLTDYDTISRTASNKSNFRWLGSQELIDLFEVDFVILIDIEKFYAKEIEQGYHKARLSGDCALISKNTNGKVWPVSQESRNITVGFELGEKDYKAALERLADSFSHCLVRYFYDCPKNKFKSSDDRNRAGWKDWPENY